MRERKPTYLLALDTATSGLALALFDGVEWRAVACWRTPDRHTAELMTRCQELLRAAGLGPEDLAAIAVVSGPGSFTGLRAGVAAAKGLALALELPLFGIGTEEAILAELPAALSPLHLVIPAGRGRLALHRYSVPFQIDPMRWEDVAEVMEIERRTFSMPWPMRAYEQELLRNPNAHYLVLRPREVRTAMPLRLSQRLPILGYGGFWLVPDEAHISTIAVDAPWRGRGLGELMFLALVEEAIAYGANLITLEVRASNAIAQRLYRKYGLEVVGRRPRYYRDNLEDALVMSVEGVRSAAYRERLEALKARLWARLQAAGPISLHRSTPN
jgi:ribosomal-protein-alanine N-acetyltransferase